MPFLADRKDVLVTLVIPVFNEADHLQDFLYQLDSLDIGFAKELVLIDDSSTDKTAKIIEQFQFESQFQFVKNTENRGKGAALKIGIGLANGEVIGIQDADFEYEFADIKRLVSPIIEDEFDVVFGSRFKQDSVQVRRTFHYLVNITLTFLSNLCSGLYLSDMETGYKFFRADVIKNIVLTSPRFGFEPEITAKIARLNVRMAELPISYAPRSYIQGKKISWKDGVAAVWQILYFNLFSRQPKFLDSMPKKYLP